MRVSLGEREQAVAHEGFDACRSACDVRCLTERASHVALAEPEAAQCLKCFGAGISVYCRHRLAVRGAIGVPKGQAAIDLSFDDQRSAMKRPVMGAAEGDEIVGVVLA